MVRISAWRTPPTMILVHLESYGPQLSNDTKTLAGNKMFFVCVVFCSKNRPQKTRKFAQNYTVFRCGELVRKHRKTHRIAEIVSFSTGFFLVFGGFVYVEIRPDTDFVFFGSKKPNILCFLVFWFFGFLVFCSATKV